MFTNVATITPERPVARKWNRPILSSLNRNVITEKDKKVAIITMGMAACQVHCLRCNHCSDCKVGNRS